MTSRPIILAALLWPASLAQAGEITVGPQGTYAELADAAAAVQAGDTVLLTSGEYYACAVWKQDRLTIRGAKHGAEARITDNACDGKAAFVVQGKGVTIENVTFSRVRSADGNGAGIRSEGRDLTVRAARFVNDQVGILATGGGTLRIEDCDFEQTGAPATRMPSVMAEKTTELMLKNNKFHNPRGGGFVRATAAIADIIANHFEDDAGTLQAPALVLDAGVVTISGNHFRLAAPADLGLAVVTGAVRPVRLLANSVDGSPNSPPLLRDWSGYGTEASGNTLPAGTEAVSETGLTTHRLGGFLRGIRMAAAEVAGRVRHRAAALIRILVE